MWVEQKDFTINPTGVLHPKHVCMIGVFKLALNHDNAQAKNWNVKLGGTQIGILRGDLSVDELRSEAIAMAKKYLDDAASRVSQENQKWVVG